METVVKIIQPNLITQAKYDYTATQKNVLYHIISTLQDKMTKEKVDKNLFGEFYIEINIAQLAGIKNHSKVLEATKDLIGKKFSYNWKNERGKESTTTTGLVSSVTHEKNSKILQVKIPEAIVPVLLYIGEGFTQYQKTIALTLKSTHAKRLYEICNRWKDVGGYTCSLDDFKEMMCLDDKYSKLSMLKTRVLDAAKKELDEQSDITFEYSLKKEKARNFNVISFKIITKTKEKEKEKAYDDQLFLILNMLQIKYPLEVNDKAYTLTEEIKNHEDFYKIYLRLQGLKKELKENTKTKKDVQHLIPFILKNDFKIDCN